jgi:hypothetical protein
LPPQRMAGDRRRGFLVGCGWLVAGGREFLE